MISMMEIENGHKIWRNANYEVHREDGPAIITSNGGYWWINGRRIHDQLLEWMAENDISWPWNEETQMLFVMKFL